MKKITIKTNILFSLLLSSTISLTASGKVYNWQLIETGTGTNTELNAASQLMMKYVKQLSNGRLIIEPAPKQSIDKQTNVFELVKNRTYQIGHTTSNLWSNKNQGANFFSSVPFGMITPETQAWFYEGGGIELMQKIYEKHGILSFPGGSMDTQMGGWFRNPIKSISDLKGLRMRIQGMSADVMKDLGVEVFNTPSDKVVSDLKSHRLDAVEWGGPVADLNMGFAEHAPYYYTAWQAPSLELQFIVNQAAYEKLSKDLQYSLNIAMRLAAYDSYVLLKHQNAQKLAELKKTFPKVKIQAFPPAVMNLLKGSVNKRMRRLVSRGGTTKEILDSLNNYQKQIRLWTRISDQAYLNNF